MVFSGGMLAVIVIQTWPTSVPWLVLLMLVLVLLISLFYLFASLGASDKDLEGYLASLSVISI